MPLIGKVLSYSQERCLRCDSKRKEIKMRTEKIKTDNGVSVIEHSQIVCTNKKCQDEFEIMLDAESKKRIALKLIRIENSEKNRSLRIAKKQLA